MRGDQKGHGKTEMEIVSSIEGKEQGTAWWRGGEGRLPSKGPQRFRFSMY